VFLISNEQKKGYNANKQIQTETKARQIKCALKELK